MNQPRPGGTEHLRRQNTALVLRSLRSDGAATRTELARRTGLAKATIGTIVAELGAGGAVSEDQSTPSGRGRPGRPVTLTGASIIGLGFEVNVDYLAAVALDLAGNTRISTIRQVDGTAPKVDDLLDLAREIHRSLTAEGHNVVGATIAVPGLVAHDNRTIAWAPNLSWDDVHLASRLESVLGTHCPTLVDNDANCAALAEAAHGVSTDVANSLYITGTVGIGAGIVHDGRLLRGGAGFAGEVGHMPIGDESSVCGCGRHGCWEASVGLRAMLRAVNMTETETPLSSAVAVAERAADDPEVRTALTELGTNLGIGLATLATVIDPSVIVLGGYFVPLGAYVVPAATEVLAARLPAADMHLPEIRLSSLGIHAAALGAAEGALAGIYTGSVPIHEGQSAFTG